MFSLLGFVSHKLMCAFDVEIDFSNGFSAAVESFKIIKTIGTVNTDNVKRVAKSVQPGPEYVKHLAAKLELYLRDKEKRVEKLKK